MIPLLCIPILNRGDLLMRLASTIDYPIEALAIVQNGADVEVEAAIDQLDWDYGFKILLHRPQSNLGVAGSWNYFMRCYCPDRPYILIAGNDVRFSPGDLARIDAGMRRHPEMVIRPCNLGHSLFAVRQSCIDAMGFFDENFYPAYLEDCDQMRRIALAGAKWADVGKADDEIEIDCVCAIHGEAPTYGSHTIYADRRLLEANRKTHENNFTYYVRKWGGPPGEEIFDRPFDDPSLGLMDWKLDPEMRAANMIFDEAMNCLKSS